MKQTLLKSVLSAILLFALSGCGTNNTETEDTRSIQKGLSAEEIKAKRTAFESRLKSIESMGFDLNQTENSTQKSTFVLQVKDTNAVTSHLLAMAHMGTLDSRNKKILSSALTDAKVGLEVDWKKLAENAPRSTMLYFIGNGKEEGMLKTFIKEKKLAAFLTLNETLDVRKAELKDIDEKVSTKIGLVKVLLKNAKLEQAEPTHSTADASDYRVDAGQFSYILENNGTKLLDFSYHDVRCSVAKQNAYLGKWVCTLSALSFKSNENNTTGVFDLKNIALEYESSLKDKKIRADFSMKFPQIKMAFSDGKNGVELEAKDYVITGNSDNVDEVLMKKMYAITSKPMLDINKTYAEYVKLLGEFMASGMTFDFVGTVPNTYGKIMDPEGDIFFEVTNQKGEAKGVFGQTITYESTTSIEEAVAYKKTKQKPLFQVKGFKYGLGIKEMHNPFPAFMEFSAMVAGKDPAKEPLSKEARAKLSAMGMQIVHDGFGFVVGPIGADSTTITMADTPYNYEKVNLHINAKLLKNDVQLTSPMASMMLLSFLQADGKLELSKGDLDHMSTQFSPQVMAMVMLYAKYEGDKAIFELKFKKGHLLINDKPVM